MTPNRAQRRAFKAMAAIDAARMEAHCYDISPALRNGARHKWQAETLMCHPLETFAL